MEISFEEMKIAEFRSYLDFDKKDTKMLLSKINKYQSIGKKKDYAKSNDKNNLATLGGKL